MNRYAQMDRNKRINRRAELRSSDIAPAKEQYIYCLKTTVYAFPDWLYPKAVKGLETNFDQIWLTSWQLVDWVMDRDRENGGKPEVHRFKYRRCQVCGLARLNLLADERRRLDESAIDGRELPCNPECLARLRQQKGAA